jgi:hypothetical protein
LVAGLGPVALVPMSLLILILASCDPAILQRAAAHAEAFDLPRALEVVRAAGDCDEAAGAAEYLEGLIGAAEAVKHGGTVDSLREVRSATHALSRRAERGDRRWEAASLALRAVASASQQERAEMAVYLTEATRIEGLLVAARLPGAPLISVHELAGDLWLQVHQFADARTAYLRAASLLGHTPRVKLGLARTADRLKDRSTACAEYRSFLAWWDSVPRSTTAREIHDARARAKSLCTR